MRTVRVLSVTLIAVATALLAGSSPGIGAQSPAGAAVLFDSDDLGGVVTSAKGPEAGVWVIAETTELPTRFAKIVVTDDRGRYLVPDLPKATYTLRVRGYGLVDSAAVQAVPGRLLNLAAVVAPDPRAAAQLYPANYWFSLMQVPPASDFPGTGPDGNGIATAMKSQAQWMGQMKTTGCQACHQLGNEATRALPKGLGTFDSTAAAWARRLESGQPGAGMINGLNAFGRQRALTMFADWTDRIAAGELPPVPPRPQGVERNIVISLWDYGDIHGYIHDAISTDKRNPTVNANGPIYGAPEVSSDKISVIDPIRNTAYQLSVPLRDPSTPFASAQAAQQPSVNWGNEIIWDGKTSPHSSMIDGRGRVWTTSVIRPVANPEFCKEGSSHPSAKLFPLVRSGRQLDVYDPKTKQFTLIDTCFGTHHLQFSEDPNDTLWFSGGGDVIGWFSTKIFDETGDAEKAQGWVPGILDTNGNGKQDGYVEPNQPIDPATDKRIVIGAYSVIENPIDHSIWASQLGTPGAIVRVSLGPNPPATALTEIYEPPFDNPKAPVQGYTPRGIDVDRNGIIWTNLSGSSHLASFDRRKCKGPLNGPTATGQHCPEGWRLYPLPGPHFKGVKDSGSADATYYVWVNQFDTFGLGKNVPFALGNGSDSLLALLPDTGKFVVVRVPSPLGFYAKGMDGRIDNPKGGWKGKGLWSTHGTRAPWHQEGGKGTRPKAIRFQLRPDALAK